MLKEIISERCLEKAYNILCNQRKNYIAQSDIWDLRHNWLIYKKDIKTQITAGTYNFDPVTEYTNKNQEICYKRTARDAVVLKAVSLVLAEYTQKSYQTYLCSYQTMGLQTAY